MAIEVETPDGTVVEFPDGTSTTTIEQVMRRQFGGPTAPKPLTPAQQKRQRENQARTEASAAQYERDVRRLDRQEQFGRAAALGGRAMLKGLVAIPDLIVDPLVRLANRATAKPLDPGSPTVGEQGRYMPEQMNLTQAVDWLADKAGAPRARNAQERVYSDVMGGIASAALPVGVGRALATSGNRVTQGVGNALAAQPGLQLSSSAAASGAAGTTREAGGGTGAQVTATILGGLTPAGVTAGLPGAVRRTFRGNNAETMRANIEAFEGAGTMPTVGQASEYPLARGLEGILAKTPGATGRMASTASRIGDEIGEGVERTAASLAGRKSAEDAGKAIVSGIRGPDGFLAKTRKISDELYADLDATIPKDTRVEVGATREALANLNAPIPGAPATSKQFQNARLAGIRQGLESDLDAAGTATRPEVSEAMKLSRQKLTEEAAAAAMRNTQRQQLGLSNMEPVMDSAAIDAKLAEELQGLADGRLPYEALVRLRSVVGRQIEDGGLLDDVPRSKWKELYGALSEDLEAASKAAGPEAQRAWGRANMYYRSRIARIEAIDHVIEKSGGPEKVFTAALSGTRDGATTLRAVMKSLPKEAQRDLTAAFVRRLGKATSSNQNDLGDAFSAQTFLTNWDRVSPEARKVLFDRHGMTFSRDMDKIAMVASNLREGTEFYRNPPGTAAAMANTSALTGFVVSLLSGNVGVAGAIAGGAAFANVVARAMTSPKFVRWLADSTTKPVGAIPAQLQTLREIAKAENLPELERIADAAEDELAQ